MSDSPLVENSARCLICGDKIVSKHRNDYVTCDCRRISIDGGLEYAGRHAAADARWEDTSVREDDLDVADLGLWKWVKSQRKDGR